MTRKKALDKFLSEVAPTKYSKGTVASWKNRIGSGAMSDEKQKQLLTENGFKLQKQYEQWVEE